jgi:hypothetical protein
MPRFVARIVAAAGRRYQLADFSSVNADQRLVSRIGSSFLTDEQSY